MEIKVSQILPINNSSKKNSIFRIKKSTAIFFVLLIILLVIFLFRSKFNERLVILNLSGPESVVSGQEVEYKLKIENRNKVNLNNLRLKIIYPSESLILEDSGEILTSLVKTISFERLLRGESKELSLKAIILGKPGEIKKIRALLDYQPANIRSDFEKSVEIGSTISKSSIPMILIAPKNALSDQQVQIVLDYRNSTDVDWNDLRLQFIFPDGFVFKDSSPELSGPDFILDIPKLKSNQGDRVVINGKISGFERENKEFRAVLQKKIGDKFFDFEKASNSIVISRSFIDLEVFVNDQKDYLAQSGDKLKYIIRFRNNSKYDFLGLELKAVLEGEMFDFTTLKTNGYFDQSSKEILWNAASNPILGNLRANQEGEVLFNINLKKDFPQGFGSKNFSIKVKAILETLSVPPDFGLDKISVSKSLITKIRGGVIFSAQILFEDPDFPINSGPFPPKVGQKTTYTIHWRIIPSGSDFSKLRVSSFLMPGINWENNVKVIGTSEEPKYNSRTGEVIWEIPFLPSTPLNLKRFEAIFQVGITPQPYHLNEELTVLKESEFEAIDEFTKTEIKLFSPMIKIQSIRE